MYDLMCAKCGHTYGNHGEKSGRCYKRADNRLFGCDCPSFEPEPVPDMRPSCKNHTSWDSGYMACRWACKKPKPAEEASRLELSTGLADSLSAAADLIEVFRDTPSDEPRSFRGKAALDALRKVLDSRVTNIAGRDSLRTARKVMRDAVSTLSCVRLSVPENAWNHRNMLDATIAQLNKAACYKPEEASAPKDIDKTHEDESTKGVDCAHEWTHHCLKCGFPSELDGITETERSSAIKAFEKISALTEHDSPIDQIASAEHAALFHFREPSLSDERRKVTEKYHAVLTSVQESLAALEHTLRTDPYVQQAEADAKRTDYADEMWSGLNAIRQSMLETDPKSPWVEFIAQLLQKGQQ